MAARSCGPRWRRRAWTTWRCREQGTGCSKDYVTNSARFEPTFCRFWNRVLFAVAEPLPPLRQARATAYVRPPCNRFLLFTNACAVCSMADVPRVGLQCSHRRHGEERGETVELTLLPLSSLAEDASSDVMNSPWLTKNTRRGRLSRRLDNPACVLKWELSKSVFQVFPLLATEEQMHAEERVTPPPPPTIVPALTPPPPPPPFTLRPHTPFFWPLSLLN